MREYLVKHPGGAIDRIRGEGFYVEQVLPKGEPASPVILAERDIKIYLDPRVRVLVKDGLIYDGDVFVKVVNDVIVKREDE